MRYKHILALSCVLVAGSVFAQETNPAYELTMDLKNGTSTAYTDSASFEFSYEQVLVPQMGLEPGSADALSMIYGEYSKLFRQYLNGLEDIQSQLHQAGIEVSEIEFVGEFPVSTEVLKSNEPTGMFAVPLPEDERIHIEVTDQLFIFADSKTNILIYAKKLRVNSDYSIVEFYGLVSLFNDLPFDYSGFRSDLNAVLTEMTKTYDTAGNIGLEPDVISDLKGKETEAYKYTSTVSFNSTNSPVFIYEPNHPDYPMTDSVGAVMEIPLWKSNGGSDGMNRFLEILTMLYTPFDVSFTTTFLGESREETEVVDVSMYSSAAMSDTQQYYYKPLHFNFKNNETLVKGMLRMSSDAITLLLYPSEYYSWY